MFILHAVVLILSINFGFFGKVQGNSTYSEFYCEIFEKNTNLSFSAPHLLELHLPVCSDLGPLNAPHLKSVIIEHCFRNTLKIKHFSSLKNISSLQLKNGTLWYLEDHEFVNLSKLNILYLGKNEIVSLSNETFKNLTQLRFLSLQNNYITRFPEKVFQPLESLQHLDLSINQITNLTKDILAGNRNLRSLFLNDNPLIQVDFPDFDFQIIDLSRCLTLKEVKLFSKVDTLILENSGVESLISSERINKINAAYGKLKDLQLQRKDYLIELDLRGSRLGLTEKNLSEYFCNMWSLERLDLSNNSLETLPQQFNAFNEEVCLMPSLKYLNLSGNQLASFSEETYLIGPLLNVLDLSHNRLKTFTLNSLLMAEKSLQSLNLAENQLTRIDFNVHYIIAYRNLKELTIYGNTLEEATLSQKKQIHIQDRDSPISPNKDCPEKPMHEWSVYDILMVVFLVGVIFYIRSKVYRREDNCCFGFNWKRSRNSTNESVSFVNHIS
nr:leucine-rich repeat-containing protein 15-like [Drosophila bipectinata]